MKKHQSPDRRDGWYVIEPLDAQRLLDEQPPNRQLRESKAIKFSRIMAAGKWRMNGEPIILDEKSHLLDGQGRCRAAVIAGKPFVTYVVHSIPRSMFPSIDTGQARGGADTIETMGGTNCVLAAAISSLAISSEDGSPTGIISRGGINNDQRMVYYKKNAERIDRAINDLRPYFKSSPLQPSILCFVYMEALDIDEEKAMTWALGVAIGEKLSSGSPMLVLRNRLIALRGEAHMMPQFERLALAIKSWNLYIAGKSVTLLKWGRKGKAGRNAEPFPEMLNASGE